jgi:hypothetical protein
MKLEELLENQRLVSGDYHATAGRTWRKFGENKLLHTPLVYSAFEFRLAIERYVFELYILMKKDDLLNGEVPNDALKQIDRFSNLVRLLHENAGNRFRLYRALLFNRIVAGLFFRMPRPLSIPDIGKFNAYWQRLSDYCHRQLKPAETWGSEKWIKKGYRLVSDVENYLYEISVRENFGWLEKTSLMKELSDERERFLNDKSVTEQSLKVRLEIMGPTLDKERL